jgi:hypothetical protein
MSVNKHKGFDALTPFFAMIEQALAGLADGDQFFDLFTDDVIFEYPYAFLGFFAYRGPRSADIPFQRLR